jgi:hypothetical protein
MAFSLFLTHPSAHDRKPITSGSQVLPFLRACLIVLITLLPGHADHRRLGGTRRMSGTRGVATARARTRFHRTPPWLRRGFRASSTVLNPWAALGGDSADNPSGRHARKNPPLSGRRPRRLDRKAPRWPFTTSQNRLKSRQTGQPLLPLTANIPGFLRRRHHHVGNLLDGGIGNGCGTTGNEHGGVACQATIGRLAVLALRLGIGG